MVAREYTIYVCSLIFQRRAIMRYHYEPTEEYTVTKGQLYCCDHPVYNRCTLYKRGEIGLAVIQQRYDEFTKYTYWTEIDPCLMDAVFNDDFFATYFSMRAGKPVDGIYPTVTIRKLMWCLRMKPLPKQRWETAFERKLV